MPRVDGGLSPGLPVGDSIPVDDVSVGYGLTICDYIGYKISHSRHGVFTRVYFHLVISRATQAV